MLTGAIVVFLLFCCYGPLPTLYYRRKPKAEDLVLTFDDGPDPVVTFELDAILRQHSRRGIFFFCGDGLEKNRGLACHIADYHQVGLHGWDHRDAWLLDPLRAVRRWRKTVAVVEELGLNPVYYRGPYGKFNLIDTYYMRKLRLPALFWDGIHRDWTDLPPGALSQRLWDKHRKGGVVLLHDGSRGKAVPGANGAMIVELDDFLYQLEEGA